MGGPKGAGKGAGSNPNIIQPEAEAVNHASRLVSKVEHEAESSISRATGQEAGMAESPRNVSALKERKEQAQDPVAIFSDNFTELMNDALWIDTSASSSEEAAMGVDPLQTQSERAVLEKEGLSNPSLGISCDRGKSEDFEHRDLKEEDQLQGFENIEKEHFYESLSDDFSSLLDYLNRVLPSDEKTVDQVWSRLSKKDQTELVDRIDKLHNLFRLPHMYPFPEALKIFTRKEFSKSKINKKLEDVHTKLVELLSHDQAILADICKLLLGLQLNRLSDSHKANNDIWNSCNDVIVPSDKSRLDKTAAERQFDKDIARHSHFVLHDAQGNRKFHTVDERKKVPEPKAGEEVDLTLYIGACRDALADFVKIEGLPDDEQDRLITILSDLVAQTPYNPLLHALNEVVNEKCQSQYVIAPQRRKTETNIRKQEDGSFMISFSLAFSEYKLTGAKGRDQCLVKQCMLVASGMRLTPGKLNERKLEDINVTLAKVHDIE